jgi:hypothetical protein
MKEKNNIEHFFQEKLNAFETHPPEEIWMNIENELKKKEEKKRISPFWWKLSGIAALLVLGYSLYTTLTSQSEQKLNPINESIVVGKEIHNSSETNAENNLLNESEKKMGGKQESITNVDIQYKNVKEGASTKATTTSNISSGDQNSISLKRNVSSRITELSKSKSNTIVNSSKKRVAILSKANQEEKTLSNGVTVSSKNEPTIQTNTQVNNSLIINENPLNNNKTIANTSSNTTKVDQTVNENQFSNGDEDVIKKEDSTTIANVELRAMEELLKEKEKKSTQKQKINRWLVTPTIAPIYFGSFTNGSPLDESLKNNQKTYNTSMSYGLGINYALNKKIKVRTGVNVFSVDYDTQGIVFYQDPKAQMMKNINPTQQGSIIQIKPLNSVSFQLDRVVSERFDGYLNQKMGYIEMPLEMTYKVLGNKFSIDLLGGFSTLFLNKNEIYLRSDGLNMKIGSATNLNNVHFSTNLGLGFNYAVFKNFDARVEPSFKYQINTFSADSGSFQPYLFGIYSGISYKF